MERGQSSVKVYSGGLFWYCKCGSAMYFINITNPRRMKCPNHLCKHYDQEVTEPVFRARKVA